MTSKERIRALFERHKTDRTGFWLGNPADETKQIYAKALGLVSENNDSTSGISQSFLKTTIMADFELDLHREFKSDFYWVCPHLTKNFYNHPDRKPFFDVMGGQNRESLNQDGVFAGVEDVAQIEAFDWPNPEFVDLSDTFAQIDQYNKLDMAVFSGMWSAFFHDLCDFFGMENLFIKMFTHPAIVEAATVHIMKFYLEINQQIYDKAASKIDAVFFGNDLGSQDNLLIGPKEFKKFVLPYTKQIVDQAKSYNLNVVMHSCGSVFDIIPDLIDAGIDGLHPLQAKASKMDANNLAKNFRNEIVFIGGVDTQDLLPFGTPDRISDEIKRLRDVFGNRFIVSPSHEALLPNVSLENALAMRDAAIEVL